VKRIYYMRTISVKRISQGFTLIELLVVIAILGVLAAALIAAINPIEQIRKSQDSSSESIATEFNQGVARYYTQHNVLPWDPAAVNPTTGAVAPCSAMTNGTAYKLSTIMGTATTGCGGYLVAEGELKPSFINASPTTTANIYVTGDTTTGSVFSCFLPQSNSVKANATTTVYTQTGGACAAGVGTVTSTCYWCSR
jgi:type IV pilus assembly protein PilE